VLVVQLVGIVLAASIGPILALGGALFLAAVVVCWRQRRWAYLLATCGVAVVGMAAVVVLNVPNSPLQSLEERVLLLRRVGNLGDTGGGLRLTVWQAASRALTTPQPLGTNPDAFASLRPWIGHGQETIPYLLNRQLPPARDLDRVIGEFWDRAHNALLDRLLTTGILGLLTYVALVAAILVAAARRALPEADAGRWGPYGALALALLIHVLETQTSLLVMPAEVLFWLLAGAAVGRHWGVVMTPSPAASSRPPAATATPTARWLPRWAWPLVGFVLLTLAGGAVLGLTRAPQWYLVATVVCLAGLVLAVTVGAFALAPAEPAAPASVRRGPWLAVASVCGAGIVAMLINGHQIRALAADVASRQGEDLGRQRRFGEAVPFVQEAARIAADQPEYYQQLGQYFATLGGQQRVPGEVRVEPTLAMALTVAEPDRLERDALFALGQVSVEEAWRRNPLEVRYLITLAELQRYWSEVDGRPTHVAAALANFARAADLKPNDVEIHAGAADTLLLAGNPSAAVEQARHAAELLPTYWYPYSVLAQAYLALGQYPEAAAAAQAGLDHAPTAAGLKPASPFDLQRLRSVLSAAQAGRNGTASVVAGPR
jgi:tetratricopeptide (TPR) repeat protein